MLGVIFGGLWSRIFAGIAAVLLAFALVQTVRIEGFLWWDGFKEQVAKLLEENGILRLDLDKIKLAQKQATERALAEKQAAEARYAQMKEQADDNLEQARDRARTAAARYASANRVRPQAKADAGGSSGADLPCATVAPEGPDGACDDAELLAVTREDFDIMVDNSVRLKEAHDWAKGLE